MSTTPEPLAAPPVAPRGRWKRRILLALVGLAGVVALAPFYLGGLLRPWVEGRIAEELDVRAHVQSIAFGWPAHLRVRGVELQDANGQLLASLDDLAATLGLGALLAGRIEAELELSYPELHLARTPEGQWNWDHALETLAARASKEEETEHEPKALPEVRAGVRVKDGHLVFHGAAGETSLSEIAFELSVDGLDHPAPFRLALEARGPEGPAGALSLEGNFLAAPGGRIDPIASTGEARLGLRGLVLAGFAPALSLFAPLEGLAGTLDGRLEFTLAPGLALAGTGSIDVSELSLQGPQPGAAPARIARVELRLEATQQGEGAGEQHLELHAAPYLDVTYEGHSNLPELGAGEITGTLSLGAELGPLSELARGWVPIQAGIEVHGRLEHTLVLEAGLADRAPRTARVHAQAGVHDLSARDGAGRALDLRPLDGLALELEAAADLERGTLTVPTLALQLGPVVCRGHAEAVGVDLAGSTPQLRTGELHVDADLERLRGTLAALVALDPASIGGRVRADLTLGGDDAGLDLAAKITAEALAFAGTSLASLQAELSARRALDGALAGQGRVRTGALTLAQAGAAPLALPGTDVHLELAENAAGIGQHVLTLESADGAFGMKLDLRSERAAKSSPFSLTLEGELEGHGDVAGLAAIAASIAPVQAGLRGALGMRGHLELALPEGTLESAGGRLELTLSDLVARDASGAELRLEALARTTAVVEGQFLAQAHTARLSSFTLDAGGLQVRASGRALGIGEKEVPELEAGLLSLSVDLARLGPELGRVMDLGGMELSGSPLTLEAELSTRDGRLEAKGRLASASVHVVRPEAPPLELADLQLDYDLGYDLALGSLHVRHADLGSRTASLKLAGTLNELSTPERARGAMQLEIGGKLERILGDLGLEPANSGRHTSGTLAGKYQLEGDRGAFRVTGKSSLEHFRLELASEVEGEAPLVVEDPAITVEVEAGITLGALDVELSKLTLDSELARGGAQGRIENLTSLVGSGTAVPEGAAGDVRFVGLKGQLAYVPDRLGLVLAPFLPGKLSGAEEQRVTFTLDGRARDLDPMALLVGTQARVDLGLGRFERPEITLGGALVLEAKEEKLQLRGDLTANGGTLQLDGTLDPGLSAAPARSRLTVTAKELRANSGLAPLLALVHPAFGAAGLAQGSLDGLIGLDLDLAYDGPLTLEALEAGWESLPKEPIHGTGRLELRGASLKGSPLLAMLADFGVDAQKALDVRPIEFAIQKGRVSYAKPWTWTFSGTETSFTGSLGLDQSLDLSWNLPVNDGLIQRWSFLSSLKGETLSIPLRGTVTKPRLEADSLLKDLAAKAAKKELESRLGLGGGKSGDDPSSMLTRADELWGQGKKGEAAALYKRLQDEFKLSLTYALNKDRIKDRSKYKEPK